MKRAGFSLIEIIVGIVLVGLLMSVLLAGIMQFIRGTGFIDIAMQVRSEQLVITRLLERDLSGVFVPRCVLDELNKALEPEDDKKSAQSETKKSAGKTEKKEESKVALEGFIFHTAGSKDMITQLSFYTNNALQGYWSDRVGTPTTRSMEVTYRLENPQMVQGIKQFELTRSERVAKPCVPKSKQGPPGRPVIIAQNVTGFHATFITLKPTEDSSKKAAGAEQKKEKQEPRALIKESTFSKEPKILLEQIKKDPEAMPSLLPNAVQCTISLQDSSGAEYSFELLVLIPVHPTIEGGKSNEHAAQQAQLPAQSKTGQGQQVPW